MTAAAAQACSLPVGATALLENVQQIADEIHAIALGSVHRVDYANGLLGIGLFFAQLAKLQDPGSRNTAAARKCFDRAIDEFKTATSLEPGMFNGLAGMAWSLRRMAQLLEIDAYEASDSYVDVYEMAFDHLRNPTDPDFDLTHGIVGIGLWGLTIESGDWRARIAVRAIELLHAQSRMTREGLTWHTPTSRYNARRMITLAGKEEFNLGLAHGVPGVIAFFAKCLASGIGNEHLAAAIRDAVRWLRSKALSGTSHSVYAFTADEERPARLAWCYGDAGVACALELAAGATSDPDIRSHAHYLALRVARRTLADSGVMDAGICHGSSGVLHIVSHLARRTRLKELESARRFWLQELVGARDASRGYCGFPCWNAVAKTFEMNPSLLTGAAGVGLVLLSQLVDDTSWDLPLLIG